MKIQDKLVERRKYIRLEAPVTITYAVADSNALYTATTKNISADGLRFETHDKALAPGSMIDLTLKISGMGSPVHAKGKIVWQKKMTLEDGMPFDVGVEFTEIEDDNKNTFLKFLCDLIYNLPKENKNV